MLGLLTQQWAPQALVVSFKLETDEGILLDKARGAMTNYKVHAVVANILHTRKDVVYLLVRPLGGSMGEEEQAGMGGDGAHQGKESKGGGDDQVTVETIRRDPDMERIEEPLVARISRLHRKFREGSVL